MRPPAKGHAPARGSPGAPGVLDHEPAAAGGQTPRRRPPGGLASLGPTESTGRMRGRGRQRVAKPGDSDPQLASGRGAVRARGACVASRGTWGAAGLQAPPGLAHGHGASHQAAPQAAPIPAHDRKAPLQGRVPRAALSPGLAAIVGNRISSWTGLLNKFCSILAAMPSNGEAKTGRYYPCTI
jgi:hypothetical protein